MLPSRKSTLGAALLLSLAACGSVPGGGVPGGRAPGLPGATTVPTTPHGLVEIGFSGVGSGSVRVTALRPQGLTDSQGGLQLRPQGSGTLTVGGTRYLYATFRVRNADEGGVRYLDPVPRRGTVG